MSTAAKELCRNSHFIPAFQNVSKHVDCGENVRTPHGDPLHVWHRVDRERGALQPFSLGPPPNRTGEFPRIRLSDDLFLSLPSKRSSCMDTSVAFVAHYQGFPPSHRHDFHP